MLKKYLFLYLLLKCNLISPSLKKLAFNFFNILLRNNKKIDIMIKGITGINIDSKNNKEYKDLIKTIRNSGINLLCRFFNIIYKFLILVNFIN